MIHVLVIAGKLTLQSLTAYSTPALTFKTRIICAILKFNLKTSSFVHDFLFTPSLLENQLPHIMHSAGLLFCLQLLDSDFNTFHKGLL